MQIAKLYFVWPFWLSITISMDIEFKFVFYLSKLNFIQLMTSIIKHFLWIIYLNCKSIWKWYLVLAKFDCELWMWWIDFWKLVYNVLLWLKIEYWIQFIFTKRNYLFNLLRLKAILKVCFVVVIFMQIKWFVIYCAIWNFANGYTVYIVCFHPTYLFFISKIYQHVKVYKISFDEHHHM